MGPEQSSERSGERHTRRASAWLLFEALEVDDIISRRSWWRRTEPQESPESETRKRKKGRGQNVVAGRRVSVGLIYPALSLSSATAFKMRG